MAEYIGPARGECQECHRRKRITVEGYIYSHKTRVTVGDLRGPAGSLRPCEGGGEYPVPGTIRRAKVEDVPKPAAPPISLDYLGPASVGAEPWSWLSEYKYELFAIAVTSLAGAVGLLVGWWVGRR